LMNYVITVPARRLVAGGGFESPFRSWARGIMRSLCLVPGLRPASICTSERIQ